MNEPYPREPIKSRGK